MPDEEIIRREFPVELTPTGDGRTLDLRIVPYDTVTRVSDPPDFVPYDEAWSPGAFDKQLAAPNRVDVLVNFEHQPGIGGIIGRGVELRDTGDALEGTFRMLSTQDADKALELVNEGVLTGVSLEAVPRRTERDANGVVRRVKATLRNVALARAERTAYKDAKVLAVREAPPEPEPEEPTPDPDPTEVEAALARVGYEPLIIRAVTRKPWDGSAARFTDEQYQRSCLIDRGGDASVKERCSLPVLEPNGDVNANALGAAAGALAGARGGLRMVSPAQKATAARKLIRYYRQAEMDAPPALIALASR